MLKRYPRSPDSLAPILGTPEEQAQLLANSLVISFFVRDGMIFQNGPGQEFRPKAGSGVTPLGTLIPMAATEAVPG